MIILGSNEGLWSMPVSGEARTPLTTVAEGEVAHYNPQLLPSGRAVIFCVWTGDRDTSQVAVYDLDADQRKALLAGTSPRFATSGHLVFWRDDGLWAVSIDPDALEIRGDPILLVEGVRANLFGFASYDVGSEGTLLYTLAGGAPGQRSLVWVDREGNEEPVPAPLRAYSSVRLSPDGQQVVSQVSDPDNQDVFIWNLARETLTRFTFAPGPDAFPIWTPDGSRVVFASPRDGSFSLYSKAADGTGAVERLTTSQGDVHTAASWSPDGEMLVINAARQEVGGEADVGVLSMDGDHTIEWLLDTEFREACPEVSPDGRWIAYDSDESGQSEVYVRPFPNVEDGKWQISRAGGLSPVWAPDGRELYFHRRNSTGPEVTMMAAAITTEPTWTPGNPVPLFSGSYRVAGGLSARAFDIAPDGQRFLVVRNVPLAAAPANQPDIVLVQNWFEELKRLVPVD